MNYHDAETGEVLEGEIELATTRALAIPRGQVDGAVVTARQFPRRRDRDIAAKITDRAVLTAETAADCLYSLPRDGKVITGPSARFAEIVASCYGNIRVGSRFVRIDADDRARQAVIVEAVAIDVEENVEKSTQVRRSIMTSGKHGSIPRPFSVDMVATTVQAAMSIAERNATLKLIPRSIWSSALDKVHEVVAGNEATLVDRRTKMIAAFAKFGVEPDQIFAALGVESEADISLNDMPKLTGMWTSLRDGEAVESVLGVARPKPAAAQNPVANPMAAPASQETEANTAPAEAAEKPADKPKATRTRKPKDAPTPAATAERDGNAPTPFDESMSYIRTYTGPADGLRDWWRSGPQLELRKGLTFEQTADLGDVFNARFNDLIAR